MPALNRDPACLRQTAERQGMDIHQGDGRLGAASREAGSAQNHAFRQQTIENLAISVHQGFLQVVPITHHRQIRFQFRLALVDEDLPALLLTYIPAQK